MSNRDFLIVECYLATTLGVRALATVFEIGLIDALLAGKGDEAELATTCGLTGFGHALVMDLLVGAGIVARAETGVTLTPGFREALRFRDLLEAKLAFLHLVAPDIEAHFTDLVRDPPRFMAASNVFDWFRYDRCLVVTEENLAATRRWVAYTSLLTRHEAEVGLDHLDLARARHMLDIGGNSGAFALAACRRAPHLSATVFDLPVVCAIGREHVAGTPEAGRIKFVAGDMRRDPLPSGPDLISFKSVLHDWPEADALHLLERAQRRLEPGGRIVIFERGALEPSRGPMPVSMMANVVFAPFYRSPTFYRDHLARLGFEAITLERIELDMPFHLLTARKPGR